MKHSKNMWAPYSNTLRAMAASSVLLLCSKGKFFFSRRHSPICLFIYYYCITIDIVSYCMFVELLLSYGEL